MMMHTIREQKEIEGGGYGSVRYGQPTGKWTVGLLQSGFGGTIWHEVAVCDTRDEAADLCQKLNGGIK